MKYTTYSRRGEEAMAALNVGTLCLYAEAPEVIEVARGVSQAKAAREETTGCPRRRSTPT